MRRGIVGGHFLTKWFDSSRTDVAGVAFAVLAAILLGVLLYRFLSER